MTLSALLIGLFGGILAFIAAMLTAKYIIDLERQKEEYGTSNLSIIIEGRP